MLTAGIYEVTRGEASSPAANSDPRGTKATGWIVRPIITSEHLKRAERRKREKDATEKAEEREVNKNELQGARTKEGETAMEEVKGQR